MSAPELERIARWQVQRLAAGLATLPGVVERVTGWRIRLESLGREIGSESCWAGLAATSAAAGAADLATAAATVVRGLQESLAELERVGAHAAAAQELASEALTLAAVADVELGPSGSLTALPPAPTVAMAADQAAALRTRCRIAARAATAAEEALSRRALVIAAATAAEQALRSLGVVGAAAPATFADLAADIGLYRPVPAPRPPAGEPPLDVARWWSALTAAAQLAAITAEPERIGGLDGVPAWARDRANRTLLTRALVDPHARGHVTALAVAAQLAAEEAAGNRVQLYQFDGNGDLVAVALGDLDTAGAVTLLVPGMGVTPEDDLDALLRDASRVTTAASAAAPGLSVAAVAWLGYRTPRNLLAAAQPTAAIRGGAVLARALDGLAAARASTGTPRPRTSVLAHSYGTVVVEAAAHRPGRLAADAVALLGSPGMGFDGARGLEASEVYDAAAPVDPVAHLDWFGMSPSGRWYGASELPVDGGTGHTGYYDPGHPTLAALGEVVAGTRHPR